MGIDMEMLGSCAECPCGQIYRITAKRGDRRIYKPKLGGREWVEHPLYGKSCTVFKTDIYYDVHLIYVDGEKIVGKFWVSGDELELAE